jgi:formylglycine-generating enzyme required for sulfatase activity
MRWTVFILALSVVSCSSKREGKPGSSGEGTATAAARSTESSEGEPSVPPPPPTVKEGGKGDCKTDYAPRPKRDPNPMCKIAGGEFMMGSGDRPQFSDWGPAHAVKLSPYYIDEFEVTVAQVVHYLNATGRDAGCSESDLGTACFTIGGDSPIEKQGGHYSAKPGTERQAFNWASRDGAMQYCAWVGKALPTEAQWEFAARHDPASGRDLAYPWGDTFDGSRTRCGQKDCPGGPTQLAPVDVGMFDGTGGHGDGTSPWGVHDMAGNVEEVIADCYQKYTECSGGCVDPVFIPTAGTKCRQIGRGGDSLAQAGRLRTSYRNLSTVPGFRCARK